MIPVPCARFHSATAGCVCRLLMILLLMVNLWPEAIAFGDEAPPKPQPKTAITTAEGLQEFLEEVREQNSLPALGALIANSDGLLVHRVVGVRVRTKPVAAEQDDKFHLGSNTKAMTAFWLAKLVENGQLIWETPLSSAFPNAEPWPSPLQQATLKQLLSHRGGMRPNPQLGWRVSPSFSTLPESRRWFVEQELKVPSEIVIGSKFSYSNLGYVAAGTLGEAVTKSTWEEELRRTVFRPLKMDSAGFGCQADDWRKITQPWPHLPDGAPINPGILGDNPAVLGPAGTVHVNLPDYGRFLIDQLRGSRGLPAELQPETYRFLHTPFQGETGYAPGGWGILKKDGRIELAHDGSNTLNYITACLIPEENRAICVATNIASPKAFKACHFVVDHIRKELRSGE